MLTACPWWRWRTWWSWVRNQTPSVCSRMFSHWWTICASMRWWWRGRSRPLTSDAQHATFFHSDPVTFQQLKLCLLPRQIQTTPPVTAVKTSLVIFYEWKSFFFFFYTSLFKWTVVCSKKKLPKNSNCKVIFSVTPKIPLTWFHMLKTKHDFMLIAHIYDFKSFYGTDAVNGAQTCMLSQAYLKS